MELPANTVEIAALIGQDPCKLGSESSFTIIAKGGLPPNPEESLSHAATVVDWEAFEQRSEGARESPQSTINSQHLAIASWKQLTGLWGLMTAC